MWDSGPNWARREAWCPGASCDAQLRGSPQVIRKVVHQLGPGDADDKQEQEELMLEGSLQEPQDLEAEDDHFMKYSILHRDGLGAKVQCGSEPCLAGTLPRASTTSAGLAGSGAPPPSVLSSALFSSPVSPTKASRGSSCPLHQSSCSVSSAN